MNSASLSQSRRLILKNSCASLFFAFLAISTAQLCRGDQASPVPANPPPADAMISALNQKANLGEYAQIEVPAGFHFIDADAARVLMGRMGNPVSSGLLGVLLPENKKWWAVLEFNETGFINDLDDKSVDSDSILKAIQNRTETENGELGHDPNRIVSVNWEIEPKYDADAHSLEWAFLAQGRSGKVVNHTIALFGRRGVLNVTTILPYSAEGQVDSIALNEVVKRITFKEGQRYADFQRGDKVSSEGLKELVMGGQQPSDAMQEQAATAPISDSTWLYAIIGGSVGLGAVMLIYGKLKRRKPRSRGYTNGHAVPAFQGNGANGRQKKVFNYHKFYSDMVLQCSGHTYSWMAPAANGNSHPRAAEAPAASVVAPAPAQTLANANLELIACQKNLIEEQRNLMHEQARIIEEKAKLIKEYNQLMEKWSEDIGNQFSLKLD